MVRLRDNKITPLTTSEDEAYAHHISTRNYDRPGWVYVSYWHGTGLRFGNEIIAVKMDGSSSVERLAHTHSNPNKPYCYRCEVHVSPSRNGQQVLFASSWSIDCSSNCGSQSNPQDYVIDSYSDKNGIVGLAEEGVDLANKCLANIL